MVNLERRRFLQTASVLVVGAYGASAFAADTDRQPMFTDKPTFDPPVLFLTWQRDPTTTMTVQWIGSAEEGVKRPIWYSKKGSIEWRQMPSVARPFPMSNQQIFRTELTGLEPDAEYRFRVGLDSAEKKFRTMPAKATDALQFISGGDSGIGDAAQHINRVAAGQDPMFVILGGDLAYENGKDGATFLQFLKNYSSQLIDDQGRLIPLLACIGNHEVNGGYDKTRREAPFFYSVFDGLFSETGYATLDFGDYMSVVLLDSNHTTPVAGEQTSWLAQQLKQREERENLFVFYHVPSYPSYRTYDLDAAESGTGHDSRKHWVPLFERYNVDSVFEHHDHTFKRTHPLLDGHVDANGISYLGDGSWGKLRRPKTPAQIPYLAVSQESYHLSLHRIEGNQRFHVALSDKGKVVDVCMTKKRART
jgi:hypothetical protein